MFAFYNEMLGGIDVGAGNAKWSNGKILKSHFTITMVRFQA